MVVSSPIRPISEQRNDAIHQKTAKVGVIGLGDVGLPLLQAFIRGGFDTIGFDIDDNKVQRLKAGESYIRHVPSSWIQDWMTKAISPRPVKCRA